MDLEEARQRIDKVNEDLAITDARIQLQEALVQELKRDGHDTSAVLQLLVAMREGRQALLEHRALIRAEIDRLVGVDKSENRRLRALARMHRHQSFPRQ
jgi:hypothetical protein